LPTQPWMTTLELGMIRKSVQRFSERIMPEQEPSAMMIILKAIGL